MAIYNILVRQGNNVNRRVTVRIRADDPTTACIRARELSGVWNPTATIITVEDL